MKRLTVVQCLPALDSGGVERSTLETARALVQRGHRSIIVSAGGRMQQQCKVEGSEHFSCDIGGKNLRILRNIHKFREFLKEQQPDIVHARSRLPAWSALLAMHRLAPKPKFVTTVHGLHSPGFYSGVMLRGEKIICVSRTVQNHVMQYWPKTDAAKIRIVSPGIDPNEFPYGHQAEQSWRQTFFSDYPKLQNGKLLLLPARATRLKGHIHALNLLSALRNQALDVRLCCLGSVQTGHEHYLAELKKHALDIGVGDYVEFTPPIQSMTDIYAASDLILQLSIKPEAFGRTVLEALSIGKPVLGWNLGGVGESLQQYFPQGRVQAFDQAMLLQSAKNILENGIVPEVLTLPGLTAMQSNMMEWYEQLGT